MDLFLHRLSSVRTGTGSLWCVPSPQHNAWHSDRLSETIYASLGILTLYQIVETLFQANQSSLRDVKSVHILFFLLLFFLFSDKKRKSEAKQEPKQNKKLKKNRDMKNKKDMKLKRKK